MEMERKMGRDGSYSAILTTDNLLNAALEYMEIFGFSVIPLIPGEKKPMIKWEEYHKRKPTRDEIISWWQKTPKANIGIVTGKVSDLFVVDFDKYDPKYNEEIALRYFPDSLVTPTVITPRNGLHSYFKFPNIELTIGARVLPGIDFRGEGGYVVAPPSLNVQGKPWRWSDGLGLDAPVAEAPSAFCKYLNNKYIYSNVDINPNACPQKSTLSTNVNKLFEYGSRDNDLFHTANCLVKGGMNRYEIAQVLENIILSWGESPDAKWVAAKIESALKRAETKERNLTAEVRDWISSTSGTFLSTDVGKCLHLSTREEQKSLSMILKRLVDDQSIERYGNKNGCFRIIDKTEDVIDWQSADVTPINAKFPLGVHEFVQIHKGNVIVIAGESNAGKTAYCLNMAYENRNIMPVKYMSSEMQDGAELRIRINEFKLPDSEWQKIKFTFQTDNFPDKIEPDGLNIIDYLDEGADAEAYKMPLRIRFIADKLKSGIAVIAIQKDPNKPFGLGGAGTMNRSRVYLTIQRNGVLTIEKAKIWKNKNDNPNGKYISFKLAAGCKFINSGLWQNRQEK
jgi:hypothetical protein